MDVYLSKSVDCKICGKQETIIVRSDCYELPIDNYTCTECYNEDINLLDNIDETKDRKTNPYIIE